MTAAIALPVACHPLEPRPLKDNPDVEMERYRVDVGAHHGVKPGQIVSAIANEANIESRFIGKTSTSPTTSPPSTCPRGISAGCWEVIKRPVSQRPLMITLTPKCRPAATLWSP